MYDMILCTCVTYGYVLKGISEDYINVIENTSKNTKKIRC